MKIPFAIFLLIIIIGCNKKSEEATQPEITDIDGNIYHSVTIGSQVWMVENLRVTRFNDGTKIICIPDTLKSRGWPTPHYCYYNGNPLNSGKFGVLYNFRVVHQTYLVHNEIAPKGWRVPDDSDWETLITFLGGNSVAGGKMKIAGIGTNESGQWQSPNEGATNESGFSAIPCGYCSDLNSFSSLGLGQIGTWWTSSHTQWNPSSYTIYFSGSNILNEYISAFNSDFRSIRCIKE